MKILPPHVNKTMERDKTTAKPTKHFTIYINFLLKATRCKQGTLKICGPMSMGMAARSCQMESDGGDPALRVGSKRSWCTICQKGYVKRSGPKRFTVNLQKKYMKM